MKKIFKIIRNARGGQVVVAPPVDQQQPAPKMKKIFKIIRNARDGQVVVAPPVDQQQPAPKIKKPRAKPVFRYTRRFFPTNEVGVYKLKNFVTRFKRIMRNQLWQYDRGIGTKERAFKSIILAKFGKGMGQERRDQMNMAASDALNRVQNIVQPKAKRGFAIKKNKPQ